jgi:hypothetical protein
MDQTTTQTDPEEQDEGATNNPAEEQQEGDQAGGKPQISGKAVNVFQRLFMAAKKIMLQPQVTPKLMEMIKTAGPVEGVVRATMLVLDVVAGQAQGVSKQAIYSDVIAGHVALQIAALAVKAGLMEDDMNKYQQPVIAALKQQLQQKLGGQQQQQQQGAQPAPAAAPQAGPGAEAPGGLLNSQG